MPRRDPDPDLSLWQRYRREILLWVAGLATVVATSVLFPGVDLSRGSPDHYWLLGGFVVVALVATGVKRLVRDRGDPAPPDEDAR